MISRVEYATYADYSPRGKGDKSVRSQALCGRIKQANPETIQKFIQQLLLQENRELFANFLGPHVTLVPAPRSAPVVKDGLWPGKILSNALVDVGLGKLVLTCLNRTEAVPKSATAGANRPDVETHFKSMHVDKTLFVPSHITIVDDVLTLGRTTFAGALRLHEAFPDAEIRAFAFIRTKSLVPEIDKIANASVGEITQSGGGGCRRSD